MAVRGADIEKDPVTIGELGVGDVTDVGGGGQAGRKAGGVNAEEERAFGHGGVDELIDADGGVKILEEFVFAGAGALSEGFVDGDAVGAGGLEGEGTEDLMVAGDAGKAPLVVDLFD